MTIFLSSARRAWPKITFVAALFSCGVAPLLARPDPPAADRLMDPNKPENKNAPHLLFRTDAELTPSPGAEAFKDFKNGPATFAEFCKLHPLTDKPFGEERLIIEVLTTEVDAAADYPSEPSTDFLTSSPPLRQQVFANSQAETEDIIQIDRHSDGSKLSPPAWQGQRLFTSLEQTSAGYTLAFTYAESWVAIRGSGAQPIVTQREVDTHVSLNPDGKWVAAAGLSRDIPSANGAPAHKVRTVVYLRLLKV